MAAVNTASLNRWERDLDANDQRIFKKIAGPLLIELGYAPDDGWQAAVPIVEPSGSCSRARLPGYGDFRRLPNQSR